MKNNHINLMFALLLILSSCTKPEAEPMYDHTIPGNWIHDVEFSEGDYETHSHYIIFYCDSFYLHFNHTSDMMYNPNIDSCDRSYNPNYKEYAKGIYSYDNEVISLKGVYTNQHYEPKTEGCEVGEFNVVYNYHFDKDNLILQNDDRREIIKVAKTEKFECENSDL